MLESFETHRNTPRGNQTDHTHGCSHAELSLKLLHFNVLNGSGERGETKDNNQKQIEETGEGENESHSIVC